MLEIEHVAAKALLLVHLLPSQSFLETDQIAPKFAQHCPDLDRCIQKDTPTFARCLAH